MSGNAGAAVTITDLVNSIRHSNRRLDKLNYLRPILQQSGSSDPVMVSAGFSAVFKMRNPSTGRLSALKCFLQIKADRQERYQKIADHFRNQKHSWLLDFSYFDTELSVTPRGQTAELLCPVLSMTWEEGPTLGVILGQICQTGDQRTLHAFSQKWAVLAQEMMSLNFAHGDLKADNIIVSSADNLVLVDYDSMFVPALAGQNAADLGGPSFQHPRRRPMDFSVDIDHFPMLVLGISLRALAIDPYSLGHNLDSDHLLFRQKDFQNPDQSAIFQKLIAQNDTWLTTATRALAASCKSKNLAVPYIEQLLALLYSAPAPAAKKQPPPKQTPPPAGARATAARTFARGQPTQFAGSVLNTLLTGMIGSASTGSSQTAHGAIQPVVLQQRPFFRNLTITITAIFTVALGLYAFYAQQRRDLLTAATTVARINMNELNTCHTLLAAKEYRKTLIACAPLVWMTDESIRSAARQAVHTAATDLFETQRPKNLANVPQVYIDHGACPGEGCLYGEWKSKKATPLYSDNLGQSVVGTVGENEQVMALTGEVHIKPVKGRVLVASDKYNFKIGDVVYRLTYQGEGIFNLWHNGKLSSHFHSDDCKPIGPNARCRFEFEEKFDWARMILWIVIMRQNGQIGWIKDYKNFSGRDRFE